VAIVEVNPGAGCLISLIWTPPGEALGPRWNAVLLSPPPLGSLPDLNGGLLRCLFVETRPLIPAEGFISLMIHLFRKNSKKILQSISKFLEFDQEKSASSVEAGMAVEQTPVVQPTSAPFGVPR
jgi:hypothetical protein